MAIEQCEISKGNSTTEPLNASEVFTGEWEQNNYADVGIMARTDADCTIFFDFSDDPDPGTRTAQSTFPVNGFSVNANIPIFHTAVKLPRWFRIRIVNGNNAQTFIRCSVYYGNVLRQGNAPLNQNLTQDADALLVRNTDPSIDLALGKIGGQSILTKFGRNSDIDTASVPEDLWSAGGEYTGFNATTNQDIEVLSNDANDQGTLVSSGTATGGSTTTLVDSSADFVSDGVAVGDLLINDTKESHGSVVAVATTTITVFNMLNSVSNEGSDSYRIANANDTGTAVLRLEQLLNEYFEEQPNQYVIMNGLTGVMVSGGYVRCSRGKSILSGSNGNNEGTISVRQAVTTANVFAQIPANRGQTTVAAYTVPLSKTIVLKRIRVAISRANGSPGSANITLNVRPYLQSWRAVRDFELVTSAPTEFVQVGGDSILGGTDIKFTIESVSDNNTIVDGAFEGILIDT